MHQGCVLATWGAVLPYHEVLRTVCSEFRCLALCDADDTYMHGPRGEGGVYDAYDRKKELQLEVCGHTSNLSKVRVHAPSGSYDGVPLHLPRGEGGFKAVGCFHGDAEWCSRELYVALNGGVTSEGKTKVSKLANLDKIDAVCNLSLIHI